MENEYSSMGMRSKRLISTVGSQIIKNKEKLVFRNLEVSAR